MRRTDRERLGKPAEYENGDVAERDLERKLQVASPRTWELERELLDDLDETTYGIGWWKPHPDDRRRILIADHLVRSTQSVRINLIEAGLHLLEYLDSSDRIAKRMSRVVSGDGELAYPKPLSPYDLLPERFSTLHVCGFFRALASALDCLAAVVIGVLAIPQPILRADLLGLHRWLRGESHPRQTRLPIHTAFAIELEEITRRAGPAGWSEWILDYRNMLVHRGRRTELNILSLESHVLDSAGYPIPLVVPTLLLAKDPHLSDVQAHLVSAVNVIREDATGLLSAALESTRHLVDAVGASLLEKWMNRRAGKISVAQPSEQWPTLVMTHKSFEGYSSAKLAISSDAMMTAPSGLERLRAACLDSKSRSLWDEGLSGT